MRRRLLSILIGFLLSLFLLCCAEWIQRFRHPQTESDFEFNSAGFRGTELVTPKPKGRTRIFFMGASTVYGVSLPLEKTFPFLTGKLLKQFAPQLDIEAVNAGRPGTTTPGILQRLKRSGGYAPDMVVVMTGYNDAAMVYTNRVKASGTGTIMLEPWYFKVHIFLRRHSVLYTSINQKISLLLYKTPRYEMPWTDLSRQKKIQMSRAWFENYPTQFAANIVQLSEWCQTQGVQFILVEPPLRPGLEREQPLFAEALKALIHQLQEVSRTRHILLCRVQDQFSESEANQDFLDDVHFSARGHEKVAGTLAEFLASQLKKTL